MIEAVIFLFFLIISMALVIKSADFAIFYSTRIANGFFLPQYVVGFIIVSLIAILPETLVAISSALEGIPSFGLGTLFGSNVADLTLVFAAVILFSGRDLRVTSRIIKNWFLYVAAIATPILFGLNGHYSRLEGASLIAVGVIFYAIVLKGGERREPTHEKISLKDIFFLITSMVALLLGADLTVRFGVGLADNIGINPILIGMFVVALGTTLPELFFSLRAAKHHHDSLALGDILGTVMADATIVVGIVALITPFSFNPRIIYVTGVAMVLSLLLLMYFMKTGRALTKKEAVLLFIFYLLFVFLEISVYRLNP